MFLKLGGVLSIVLKTKLFKKNFRDKVWFVKLNLDLP